ncbi:MAG: putative peptidoglycan glycosyltransferase FtsW [Spirochaetota bacterium]
MKRPDISIILIVLILMILGINVLYNALSIYRANSGAFFTGYLAIIALAFAVGIFFTFFDLDRIETISFQIILIGIFALLIVLVPFIGKKVGGSRRWIHLIFFNVQPSEFVKLGLIIYLSSILARKGDKVTAFAKGFLPPFIVSLAAVFLVMLEPDVGTSLLIMATAFAIFFYADVPVTYLISTVLFSVPLFYIIVSGKAYIWYRIVGFLNPWDHKSGEGYHLVQSFKSFALGGFFGSSFEGLLERSVTLPAATTDFVFAVAAQTMGFVGCTAIVLLFLAFLARGMRIVRRVGDPFRQYCAFGIVFSITFQALVNIAVVVGVFPTTGFTLPFVSYGNNSLIVTMAMVGILLNISREAA